MAGLYSLSNRIDLDSRLFAGMTVGCGNDGETVDDPDCLGSVQLGLAEQFIHIDLPIIPSRSQG